MKGNFGKILDRIGSSLVCPGGRSQEDAGIHSSLGNGGNSNVNKFSEPLPPGTTTK